MNRHQLIKQRQHVQLRIAVWCVLTICFAILNLIKALPFLQWIVWLAALYTLILIAIWTYLTIQLFKNK
ncbi:hypothetical protein H9564_06620 [Limosilactobacillus sp. Sa3CUN2]|uniref:Uncharacterized protein n=1 Tax=Limosilactobacillus avistercoris TaxID=2762243 RepID=A0ABR8PDJ8_9LACO|nr:hypothetical protein [Limosilactobacillus avistercoris]MBD7895371.1 hypothetical protein [Limosilactobacillus avistercoris]